MIELKGTENAMALRGRSLSGCVLDEAAFMDSGVWFEVLRPALADKQGWALFISTPEGTASWFYIYGASPVKKTMTGNAGPIQPSRGETSHQRRWRLHVHNLTQEHSAQEFEASFENLSGLVAINFSDENISKTAEDIPQLPLWIGLDFNVDNMSAVFGIRVGEDLHIFDELIMTNATTWDVADEINHRFGLTRKKTSPPTPLARPAKLPASASPTTPSSANRASKSPHPASPWKIRDKVNCVNTAILDGTGARRLLINPRCRETIKSLRTLVYDDNGLPNKKLGVDHCFDALGYLCLMKFNLNKGIKIGQSNFKLYGSATR